MITEYYFIETHSLDAKQTINFLDEMHFDLHAKVKSLGNKNFMKKTIKLRKIYLHLG